MHPQRLLAGSLIERVRARFRRRPRPNNQGGRVKEEGTQGQLLTSTAAPLCERRDKYTLAYMCAHIHTIYTKTFFKRSPSLVALTQEEQR